MNSKTSPPSKRSRTPRSEKKLEVPLKDKNHLTNDFNKLEATLETSIKKIQTMANAEIKTLKKLLRNSNDFSEFHSDTPAAFLKSPGTKSLDFQAVPSHLLISHISFSFGDRSAQTQGIIRGKINSRPDSQTTPIDEDDVDIDGVDTDDVYIRDKADVAIFNGCSPFGTRKCTTRSGFVVYNEYKEPEFVTIELGKPHVDRDGATVCITVPRTMISKGKVRSTYYRQIDCECPADDWTELAFHSRGDWRDMPKSSTPLAPWTWCDTDWGRFTINLLKDLLKSAANGIGSGIGGGIGGAAGDALGEPLKEILDQVVEPIADKIKEVLDEAGFPLKDSDDDSDTDNSD